ncbi:MAG: hypothetical protein PHQ12_08650 [Chthoniobacteraceae bacterium]|nr:hypothetical protein [Chthoniobacteraceae bacterium]
MNFADFQRTSDPAAADPLKWIRRLIWLYFVLLIYEGALRKWVMPGLANPLLIVRDPVVILIYGLAFAKGVYPSGSFAGWITGLGIVTFLVSLVSGAGNLLVSLYGWRTDFLHLPLIFLMPKVLTPRDVRALCIGLLLTAIPMVLLVMVQFRAGPSAWVNVGVGGGEGGQLDVGFGKIRPPGTFSFTNGLANYLTLVAACLLFAVLDRRYYPRWLLFSAAPATILMVVISGSRATVSAVVISVAVLVLICLRRPGYIGGSLKFVLLALPGLWLVMSLPVFQEGMMVHAARFGQSCGGVQHGIIERALGDYLDGFRAAADAPFLGYGLGIGTNAAAGMLSGERGFLLAEGEWARVVKEAGPVLGMAFLLLRVAIAAYLGWMASFAFERQRNPLPLLVFSASFLLVIQGQFGQPTALGFAVFGAGLCLAAMNAVEEGRPEFAAVQVAAPRRRGRSIFAERLHGGAFQ